MKIIGHRGASAVAPENTMAAFVAAREAGADGVELDVHAAAEGELFVIHDYAVDRTTTGTGLVFDLPAAEISHLDAGAWFAPEFAGERVPRLAEVLELEGLEFEVELKCFTAEAMLAVVDAVQNAGVLDCTEFTSWNLPMLMDLKNHCPEGKIGIFSRRREAWMPDEVFERTIIGSAAFTTADVVHVYAGDITPDIVAGLHAQGRKVHANDATSTDQLRHALESAADRTSTNNPAAAVAFLRAESARS